MRFVGIAAVCTLLLMSIGCGKFDVVNQPAQGISESQQICIVRDENTRAGFLDAMKEWLEAEQIPYEVYPSGAQVDSCEWTMQYFGKWSWDVGIFLSHAEISAYKDGKPAGLASLRVGQWDAYKFEKGDVRVKKMMDMLFGKQATYIMPKKEEDPKEED